MKRPLFFICILYIIGILAGYYITSNLVIVISVLSLVIFFALKTRFKIALVIAAIISFNIGMIFSHYNSDLGRSAIAPFEGKNVNIEGTLVDSIKKDKYYVVKLKVNKINENAIKPEVIRITYNNNGQNFNLKYGDLVVSTGIVELPDGQKNPGGFNYKRYLLIEKIYTTMSVKDIHLSLVAGGDYSRIVKYSLAFKERIVEVIEKSLPKDQAALLEGIVISKTDNLDEDIKTHFSDSGLTHLMAVSGMNVAFLVIPLVFLFRRLKANELAANLIISAFLGIFVIITGSSPSVIRAVIMNLVVLFGKQIDRQSDILTSIAFSALLLLLYNPLIVFDIGFQLSYAATIGILGLYKKIKESISNLPNFLSDVIAVTLSAQIAVIPIIAYNFNKISLVSFLSNIVAAPLSGIILILGLCMSVLGQLHIIFSNIFGGLNYLLLTILLYIAKISSQIPFATITISTPKIIFIFMYYLIFLLVVSWHSISNMSERIKGIKEKININYVFKIGGLFCIIIILCIAFIPKPLEISFIDVGQGESIFIKTPKNKIVLLDCGGPLRDDFDVGEKIIVPFLLDKGIKRIDIIVLSHADSDHTCGLESVISNFDTGAILLPQYVKQSDTSTDLLNTIKKYDAKIVPINTNQSIKFEKDLYFEAVGVKELFDNDNENSMVLRLSYKNRKFLFAGDISENVEKLLLNNKKLSSDVLKVPHHGSKNSTSSSFLDVVRPKIAVISVGEKNMFGHPSSEVIDRLKQREIDIFRTDKNGCISVISDGKSIQVNTMNGVVSNYEL